MTATWYLRRVRLALAHQQLRAADPASGVTVAAVARRGAGPARASSARPTGVSSACRPSQTLRRQLTG